MSRENVLVDDDWLEKHLDEPGIVVVEVGEVSAAYYTDHISGAVALGWKADLQDQLHRDFIDQAGFEALLSANGVGNDDTVVLYGGNNDWFAAYAYWYLKVYGHADVKLLDGGRKRWELDGSPLTGDPVDRLASRYRAQAPDQSIRALPRRGRRRHRHQGHPRRSVAAGVLQRDPGPGTLPSGAAAGSLAPHRRQRAVVQVRRQRRHLPARRPAVGAVQRGGLGLDGRDTIVYCRIGERSAHSWFVLHELLDQPSVKNYDGSWVEYGSLVGVPVER